MYSVGDYGWMLADLGRTQACGKQYGQEIGTGLGYFAMLACQLGARRVYAMEVADVVGLAASRAQQVGIRTISGRRTKLVSFPATTSQRLEHIAAVDQQVEVGELSQAEVAAGLQAKCRSLQQNNRNAAV